MFALARTGGCLRGDVPPSEVEEIFDFYTHFVRFGVYILPTFSLKYIDQFLMNMVISAAPWKENTITISLSRPTLFIISWWKPNKHVHNLPLLSLVVVSGYTLV